MHKNKTILIVDDDIDYLIQQKAILESKGFNVITAQGVNRAREVLKKDCFDLAVVDLMMENMDSGFVLSYELKKIAPTKPVIMVTAVTSQTGFEFDSVTESEKKWIKADAIFTKPIRAEQLIKEINRLLITNV
jgi:DNA-binding NtrC family response regulator